MLAAMDFRVALCILQNAHATHIHEHIGLNKAMYSARRIGPHAVSPARSQDAIIEEQKACKAQDARHRNLEAEMRLLLKFGVPL